MDHLGVDADDQRQVVRRRRDVLGGVRQRGTPAELLVADEVGVLVAQSREQLGPCLEAVVRAVVDHARQVRARRRARRRSGRAGPPASRPRQDPGDHHQSRPPRPTAAWAACAAASRRARAPGADDDGDAGGDQSLDPRRRCSPASNGQSPIDPQYTTPVIPASISRSAVATSASKSAVPSASHGVISAGRQPWNTVEITRMSQYAVAQQDSNGRAPHPSRRRDRDRGRHRRAVVRPRTRRPRATCRSSSTADRSTEAARSAAPATSCRATSCRWPRPGALRTAVAGSGAPRRGGVGELVDRAELLAVDRRLHPQLHGAIGRDCRPGARRRSAGLSTQIWDDWIAVAGVPVATDGLFDVYADRRAFDAAARPRRGAAAVGGRRAASSTASGRWRSSPRCSGRSPAGSCCPTTAAFIRAASLAELIERVAAAGVALHPRHRGGRLRHGGRSGDRRADDPRRLRRRPTSCSPPGRGPERSPACSTSGCPCSRPAG